MNRVNHLARRTMPVMKAWWPIPALLGIALIAWGQWLWFQSQAELRDGALAVLAGGTILALVLRPAEILPWPDNLIDSSALAETWWHRRLVVGLAGVGLCLYTGWRAVERADKIWTLLLLWGVGLALALAGLVPPGSWSRWAGGARHSWRDERLTWLTVGAIFAVGLVARTAWLDKAPYIQAGDEAAFAIQAVWMDVGLDWKVNPFKYDAWQGHPLLYHSMIALSIQLFGQTVAAARVPSAVLGALTVPAVYLLGRRMFDRRIGLVAAIFMAAYPLHVHFSRTAINQVGDPLFAALALACLTRALRENEAVEAGLAGLALGLSQYFYGAGRMVPLLILAYVGAYAVRQPCAIWRRRGVLAVMLLVAVAAVFPNLYAIYSSNRPSLSPRLDQVSIWATDNVKAAADEHRLTEYWTRQIRHSFMAYVQTWDESGFYGAYNPVLGWYAGVPFMVGLVVVLRGAAWPRSLLLIGWVGITAVLGGVLLVDPPHYTRYVAATPALAVLVALGIVTGGMSIIRIVKNLWRAPSRGLRVAQRAVPIGLALLLAGADQRAYIVDYLPQKLIYGERTVHLNEAAQVLNSFGGRYTVWFFSSAELDLNGADLIPYQAWENDGLDYFGSIKELPIELARPGRYAFVIAPERFEEVAGALAYYLPGGTMRRYDSPSTRTPLVYVYFVELL